MQLYQLPTPILIKILDSLTVPSEVGCFLLAIENDNRYVHHYLYLLNHTFTFTDDGGTNFVVGLILKEHVGVSIRSQQAPPRKWGFLGMITTLNIILGWLVIKMSVSVVLLNYYGIKWLIATSRSIYKFGGWKVTLAVTIGVISLLLIYTFSISMHTLHR